MTSLVADLGTLVAFPTVSSRPVDALASFMATRFEDLGFRIERFRDPIQPGKYNVVASIGPAGTNGLVLSGHMDVVPTDGQPWSTDPFAMVERDGSLFGRGTADMKGFLAATLAATARLQPSDYQRELVLIWTYDEEIGCLGSAKLVQQLKQDGRALPTAALIGEPTSFKILRAHPGHVALTVDIKGAAAHSSRPDLGTNAIEAAAEVVQVARAIARQLNQEAEPPGLLERPWVALNVARIHGGSAINIVPDHCRVEIGYRQLPGMADLGVFERIREALAQLSHEQSGGAHIEVSVDRVTPAMLTPDGTALQALLDAHSPHDECGAASFATDGGNLAKLGMDCLVFGPGSIEVAHQADEFIPIDELHQSVDIIEDVIRRRCC